MEPSEDDGSDEACYKAVLESRQRAKDAHAKLMAFDMRPPTAAAPEAPAKATAVKSKPRPPPPVSDRAPTSETSESSESEMADEMLQEMMQRRMAQDPAGDDAADAGAGGGRANDEPGDAAGDDEAEASAAGGPAEGEVQEDAAEASAGGGLVKNEAAEDSAGAEQENAGDAADAEEAEGVAAGGGEEDVGGGCSDDWAADQDAKPENSELPDHLVGVGDVELPSQSAAAGSSGDNESNAAEEPPEKKPKYILDAPWRSSKIPVPPPRARTSHADAAYLPSSYGYWEDWNSPESLAEEQELAKQHMMPAANRGPDPSKHCGKWKGMVWDDVKSRWSHLSRADLPEPYKEWIRGGHWTEEADLVREAQLAAEFMVPFSLRGPPGPDDGGPFVWRGMHYRPKAGKWMQRGGQPDKQEAHRQRFFESKGKSSGKGSKHGK